MAKSSVIITGVNGEIGASLATYLLKNGLRRVIGIDNRDLEFQTPSSDFEFIKMDIVDPSLINILEKKDNIETIFHLAAILSTAGERDPIRAHKVNVEGSLALLNFAQALSEKNLKSVKFVFPSTISIYGIPKSCTKLALPPIREDEYLDPITMYGANKLYVEKLGNYFCHYYRFLEPRSITSYLDFRAVRFPGILSADSMPSGGTSDYGPEMLHFAAQNKAYECFVPPEATLPFMAMPDAVRALTLLEAIDRSRLTQNVYNVNSFSISAEQIHQQVLKYFPQARISYKPHAQRSAIVESWPASLDDSAARRDWNWQAEFGLEEVFGEYLVPAISKRYSTGALSSTPGLKFDVAGSGTTH